jgi:hypothetical protein
VDRRLAIDFFDTDLRPGDVVVANDPYHFTSRQLSQSSMDPMKKPA